MYGSSDGRADLVLPALLDPMSMPDCLREVVMVTTGLKNQ